MTAARMQELEEMATKLLATARELPPGQHHHNALREIARFRAQIAALQGADLRPAQRGPKAEGEVSAEQIRELEKMTKELVTVARKLPHGPDRETVLQEIREFRAQISGFESFWDEGEGKMTEPERDTRPWAAADDELLRSLALKRMDAKVIGLQMSRTPASVRRRASQLNIILRKARSQKQMS